MAQNQMTLDALVVVMNPDRSWKEIVACRAADGQPSPYSGANRMAAFEKVFKRPGTQDEIVNQTTFLDPEEVTVFR